MACVVLPKRYRDEPPVVERGICALVLVSRRARRKALLVRRPSKTLRRLEMASALGLEAGVVVAAVLVAVVVLAVAVEVVEAVANRVPRWFLAHKKFLATPKPEKVLPCPLEGEWLETDLLVLGAQCRSP